MACSIKAILDAANHRKVRFAGGQLKKHEGFKPNDVWCEFPCTRADDHPVTGKHWYEDGNGLRVEFDVTKDDVWMA